MKPLALPPRSSRTPGGRVIVPAASSTVTVRHAAPGCGRAGRRGGALASARRSGVRARPASVRS
jgi:hypothetical protein